MTFDLLYVDSPWKFKTYSAKGMGRSADNHYPTMTLKEIRALDVVSLANKNCILLTWITDPFLEAGMEIFKHWGFKYSTVGFYWAKLNQSGEGWFMGTGYHSRANPELCLLYTRGKGLRRINMDVRKLIVAPLGKDHSAKPHETYNRIERLYGDVSRVELFARNAREGWRNWGLDAPEGMWSWK